VGLQKAVQEVFDIDLPIVDWAKEEGIADEELRHRIQEKVDATAARKAAEIGPDVMRQVEKGFLIETLDFLWREHLIMLDHLRQAVGLRGYAQRDPLNEYKGEAFTLFENMLSRLRVTVTERLMRVQLAPNEGYEMEMGELPEMHPHHVDPLTGEDEFQRVASGRAGAKANGHSRPSRGRAGTPVKDPSNPDSWGKVSRNALCPCGSGKKYKHCHGALVES
jgi:preprotein translocase subunit SecA